MSDDVVYICREGDNNEELRYSLRSLSNLPHRQVWIFGGCPSWVDLTRVVHVPVRQDSFTFRDAWLTKYLNVRRSWEAICDNDLVSERFTYMNDDFYITEAIDEVPVLNYGTEDAFNGFFGARQGAPSSYVLAERATLAWLRELGIEEPLSYSLHTPLPILRPVMGHILSQSPETVDGYPLHIRTIYGNLAGIGGETIKDVKVERGSKGGVRRMNGKRINGPIQGTRSLPKPFASSSDRSFVAFDVGRWIRAMFMEPCIYER